MPYRHRFRTGYCILLLGLWFSGLSPAQPPTVGDVNADGVVDGKDILAIQRHLAGLITLNADEQARADVAPLPGTGGRVVGDGQVTEDDALRLLRYAVKLISLEELTGQLSGPTITAFTPSSGQPGTRVTLRGLHFVAGSTTENAVDFGGVPARVVSATETEIVTEVPPNAVTGPIRLRTPGGEAVTDREFVVPTAVSGKVELPPGLQPTDFTAVTSLGDATIDAQGQFTVLLRDTAPTLVGVMPTADEAENGFLSWVPPGAASQGTPITVNARTTAESLIFMQPLFLTDDPTGLQLVRDTMQNVPEVAQLAQLIEQKWPQSLHPLDDPEVDAALQAAILAVNDALPATSLIQLSPPPSAQAVGRKPMRGKVVNVDLRILQPQLGDFGVQVGSLFGNPVAWFLRLAQVDPEDEDFKLGPQAVSPNAVFDRTGYTTSGVAPARSFFGAFDLVALATQVVLSGISVEPRLQLTSDAEAVYVLRMFSGALQDISPNKADSALMKQLPGDQFLGYPADYFRALTLNVVLGALDGVELLIDVKSLLGKEALIKMLGKMDLAFTKTFQEQFPGIITFDALSRMSGSELARRLYIVATATLKAGLDAVIAELAEASFQTRLWAFAKSTLKLLDVVGKIGKVGKIADRIAGLTGVSTLGLSIPPTPLETALIVVGDPFAPKITDHPLQVFPGQQITIQGKRFFPIAGENKVFLGTVQGTVTSVNASRTELTIVVPGVAPGTYDLSVETSAGAATSDKRVTVLRAPVIEAIVPEQGFAANPNPPDPFAEPPQQTYPGTEVTIRGRFFNPQEDQVFFPGGVRADIIQARSGSTQLVVYVPQGAQGTGKIEVRTPTDKPGGNPGEKITAFSARDFTVWGPPSIGSVDPLQGPMGTRLTLVGSNLGDSRETVEVSFLDPGTNQWTSPGSLVVASPQKIKAQMSLQAPNAPVAVAIRVRTPAGETVVQGYTLTPGAAFGGAIAVTTTEDVIAPDDQISLREAVLLATLGRAGFEARYHKLTLNRLGDNGWIIGEESYVSGDVGPLTSDSIGPHSSLRLSANTLMRLTRTLPIGLIENGKVQGGFDEFRGLGIDASGVDPASPAIRVLSSGNALVDGLIANAPGVAIEVLGRRNHIGFAYCQNNGVGVFVHSTTLGGLQLTAENNAISGTFVGNGTAIRIEDSSGNLVRGVGAKGNQIGIEIGPNAADNRIERSAIAHSKLVAGQTSGVGIWIHGSGAIRNWVGSKYVIVAFNASHGILINGGAQQNRIAFDPADAIVPIIASNAGDGIRIEGAGTDHNEIVNAHVGFNLYGTHSSWASILGSQPLGGNQGNGIAILGGAAHNQIGPSGSASRFVRQWSTYFTASGNNGKHGVLISGNGVGNVVRGCWIGYEPYSEAPMPNGMSGIAIQSDASGSPQEVRIEENNIGSNQAYAILIEASAASPLSVHLARNFLGRVQIIQYNGTIQTDDVTADARNAAPDTLGGMRIVGDGQTAHTLTIVQNQVLGEPFGVELVGMRGDSTDPVLIADNLIAESQAEGLRLLSNTAYVQLRDTRIVASRGIGIELDNALHIRLEGLEVLSGRTHGILARMSQHLQFGPGAQPGLIAENQGDGLRIEAGSQEVTIGDQNIVGNLQNGVVITGDSTANVALRTCQIFGNGQDGVRIEPGASLVTLGGFDAMRNAIGGNGTGGGGWGVHLTQASAPQRDADPDRVNVLIAGNFIGTQPDGKGAAPNASGGILVQNGWQEVVLGGQGLPTPIAGGLPTEGNLIAGNNGPGIQVEGGQTADVWIDGNLIGLNLNGDQKLPNTGNGILVQTNVQRLAIGTVSGNVISGNGGHGLYLLNLTAPVVRNNLIGTDVTGSRRLGNTGDGLWLDGVQDAVVRENTLVDNRRGIVLATPSATGNRIVANVLGLGVGGQRLGQRGTGIEMVGGAHDNVLADNTVALCTNAFGIALGAGTDKNRVLGGSIFANEAGGIAAANPPAPRVTLIRPGVVVGEVDASLPDGSLVQVYADRGAQGEKPLGQTRARGRGWSLRVPVPRGLNITATVTDPDGNTSAFGGLAAPVAPPPIPAGSGPDPTQYPLRSQQILVFGSTRTGNPEIFSQRPDQEAAVPLTDTSAAEHSPALSPDGTRIAFVSERSGNPEIWVMDVDGTNPTQITDHAAPDYDPAWSPDGTQIAFVSERDGNPEIYLMNADGTGLQPLTHHPGTDRHPAWSPSGNRIAFTSDRSGHPEVWVLTTDGNPPAPLTDGASPSYDPAWSPDGTQIAFVSERDGNPEIYLMNADGSNVQRLTSDPGSDAEPTWSPDGRWVAFTSTRLGDAEIFAQEVGGNRLERLTVSLGVNDGPSWGEVPASLLAALP